MLAVGVDLSQRLRYGTFDEPTRYKLGNTDRAQMFDNKDTGLSFQQSVVANRNIGTRALDVWLALNQLIEVSPTRRTEDGTEGRWPPLIRKMSVRPFVACRQRRLCRKFQGGKLS